MNTAFPSPPNLAGFVEMLRSAGWAALTDLQLEGIRAVHALLFAAPHLPAGQHIALDAQPEPMSTLTFERFLRAPQERRAA